MSQNISSSAHVQICSSSVDSRHSLPYVFLSDHLSSQIAVDMLFLMSKNTIHCSMQSKYPVLRRMFLLGIARQIYKGVWQILLPVWQILLPVWQILLPRPARHVYSMKLCSEVSCTRLTISFEFFLFKEVVGCPMWLVLTASWLKSTLMSNGEVCAGDNHLFSEFCRFLLNV